MKATAKRPAAKAARNFPWALIPRRANTAPAAQPARAINCLPSVWCISTSSRATMAKPAATPPITTSRRWRPSHFDNFSVMILTPSMGGMMHRG
ncbi:hypothetical protein D3C72_2293960 [compost metagenome]